MSPRAVAEPDGPPRRGGAIGTLFALSLGALLARVAAQVLSPGALGLFDFAVYVGLALSVALAYRGFVRRALIARRRDRARRAEVQRDEARRDAP